MLLKKSPERTSAVLEEVRRRGRSIGFVPTMGCLHRGHASLIKRARAECGYVVVSIFVNPTQFGPDEDFGSYPRDISADLALCRELGVDLVFHPAAKNFYPEGFGTFIDVGPLGEVLEGASRPGHFRGVATVVVKLLNVVGPGRAYFGRKDAQQAVIVRKVVGELNLPVVIRVCPTVREPDGLSVSSRNVHLSDAQRGQAAVLYRSLVEARRRVRSGERSSAAVIRSMKSVLGTVPDASIDYIAVNHPVSLEPLKTIAGSALVSLAVRIGRTRLIDNIIVNAPR